MYQYIHQFLFVIQQIPPTVTAQVLSRFKVVKNFFNLWPLLQVVRHTRFK